MVNLFKLDSLNGFIILFIGIFFTLTFIYSLTFMKGRGKILQYYTYIILAAISSIAAVLANNLLLLLACWGFLGLLLYLLIAMGTDQASLAAKKSFIIIGGTDALMLLGIAIIYYLTGTFQIDKLAGTLFLENNFLAISAYLCIATACFAKAGAMPLHSWIPDCAQQAPVPVVAYLPGSLDKLLGIYLLARISSGIFIMSEALKIFLMLAGAFTIIVAVMMALIQHNMKKLLGFHAVSQVGYMVLGIGTGNPIGIAGGVFHMLNNAVYKSCLFFTAGNVEYRTKTTELDKLGGLSKLMPLTYTACLIASLSISGVPPFNGFVSKWMIYQGLVSRLQSGNFISSVITTLCLVLAMFGSGLTLASFIKLIHAAFLGQRNSAIKEVPWTMWFPPIILAVTCIVFGVFANQLPLKYFILPVVGRVDFIGSWYAGLSTLLIIIGLLTGLVAFRLKGLRPVIRQDKAFVGGEEIDLNTNAVSGTEFYNTIKEIGILKYIYTKAGAGFFDIYEQGKKLTFGVAKILQFLHNGVLSSYLVWLLLGMAGLFFFLAG